MVIVVRAETKKVPWCSPVKLEVDKSLQVRYRGAAWVSGRWAGRGGRGGAITISLSPILSIRYHYTLHATSYTATKVHLARTRPVPVPLKLNSIRATKMASAQYIDIDINTWLCLSAYHPYFEDRSRSMYPPQLLRGL